eukprot:11456860-Alexandrium_andersonii.AAC.1
MGEQEVARPVAAARTRLEFVTKLYRAQLERGARFPREHPGSAASWQEPCVVELSGQPEVESGVGR